MRRVLALFVTLTALLLCGALPALAQAPSVEVGKAFKVAFDATPNPLTAGYRLYVCPAVVTDCTTKVGADIPASLLQAGSITVDVAAVAARGPYTLQASAFNADKEVKSLVTPFTAKLGDPPPPGQPRLVIIGSIADNGQAVWDWRLVPEETANQLLALAR